MPRSGEEGADWNAGLLRSPDKLTKEQIDAKVCFPSHDEERSEA